MYALVEYTLDKQQVIVSIDLIKNFHPKHSKDFDSSPRMVYWCSRDNVEHGYYDAVILRMEDTKAEMVREASKGKRKQPLRVIDSDGRPGGSKAKQKVAAAGSRSSKSKHAAKRKLCEGIALAGSSSDTDDNVVPKRVLDEEKEKVKKLQKKCRELERLLQEEREYCRRFQNALLQKIEVLAQQPACADEVDRGDDDLGCGSPAPICDYDASGDTETAPSAAPQYHPQAAQRASTAMDSSEDGLHMTAADIAGGSADADEGFQTNAGLALAVGANAQPGVPDVPLFETTDGKIHCGGAVYVETAKMDHAFKAKTGGEAAQTEPHPTEIGGCGKCLQEVCAGNDGARTLPQG